MRWPASGGPTRVSPASLRPKQGVAPRATPPPAAKGRPPPPGKRSGPPRPPPPPAVNARPPAPQSDLAAAEPRQAVTGPHDRRGVRRELGEHAVARRVPEPAVDLLERVDVGQEQREPLAGGQRSRERLVERPPVLEPGQRIDARHPVLHPFEVASGDA